MKRILLIISVFCCIFAQKSSAVVDKAKFNQLIQAASAGAIANFPEDVNAETVNGSVATPEGHAFNKVTGLKEATPLIAAIYSKKNPAPIVDALLKKYSAIIDVDKLVDGRTPLMHAVTKGYVDIVNLLLNKGAHTNIKAKAVGFEGDTVLHLAVEKGNPDIVKALVKSKTIKEDLQVLNLFNSTPLEDAKADPNKKEIVAILEEAEQGPAAPPVSPETELVNAIKNGVNIAPFLKKVKNLNKLVDGLTPLMHAVLKKQT